MVEVHHVLSAGQFGEDHGVVRYVAQPADEAPGALDGAQRVPGAVDDQERRRAGVEVPVGLLLRRRLVGLLAEEVAVVAVEADRCAHRGVGVLEAGLERRVVRGERAMSRHVGAGRAARHEHPRRICAVPGAVLADPGDDLLGVDLLAGEGGLGPQPVVGADAHPSLSGEPVQQGTPLAALRAAGVVAAVEVDQDRASSGASRRR